MKKQPPTLKYSSEFRPYADVAEALGQSEVFLEFQEHLSRVAPIDRPVLLSCMGLVNMGRHMKEWLI